MQGFAHARMPIILENEVWLPHTPNPRTCWTFFSLQSSLFPSPISFLSSSFLLHPRNSKIFSSFQLWEYLHPPQVLSKKKKRLSIYDNAPFLGVSHYTYGKKTNYLVCPSFFVFPSFYCWLIHNFQSEANYLQKGREGRSWPNNFPAGNRTSSQAFKNCFHFT